MLNTLILGIALIISTPWINSSIAESPINCGKTKWLAEPRNDDGVFEAVGKVECGFVTDQDPPRIARRILQAIERERTHHSPAQSSLEGTRFDVSHKFKDEGDLIWLHELVTLHSSSEQLKYQAQSLEIDASGLSSYLREIEFSATLSRPNGNKDEAMLASMQTKIRIKRPWFAPAFMFYPIAEQKTRSKLEQQARSLSLRFAHTEESPLP